MKRLFSVLLSISMLLPLIAQGASSVKTDNAKASAMAWLEITDSSGYARSWERAGNLFQQSVEKQKWQKQLESARLPLGTVRSRELQAAESARALPGAPAGQYVVLQYETRFEKSPKMLETVTVMLDEEAWKVVGYFIKPMD